KVNAYESESYIQGLEQLGYEEIDFKESADVYIINTCAVTNTAASKSRQKINQAKKRNADAVICVVGCYVQASVDAKKLDVDVLIGSSHKNELPSLIHEALMQKTKSIFIEDISNVDEFEEINVRHFHHRTRAFLKIQDGCNQYCSYCIIPFARGKERSMPLEKAIISAQKLVNSGHHEIVLTGIHTGRYGNHKENLLELLKAMVKIEGLDRIRISSIEINEISDDLIAFIANNKKIANHLHIPIQSGSDEILRRMNRPSMSTYFKERVALIRKMIPHISISSDIIIGFPGESDKHFEETLLTLQEIEFSFLHVFPFSKRDGTKAEKLSGHLPNDVKKKRCQEVSFLSEKHYNRYIASFINHDVEVLFEYEKDGYWYGHTSEYILTRVKSTNDLSNKVYTVFIKGNDEDKLWGELGGIS
ncbi:tRNA (N(6)-L-threonylcarbamoyladenosine(37)-C(2))-methylthiotransferase MtaB, partial [Breznakia sp. OttesenSCG-928-G09]|nr:tRNA (N(6)-L-threonylcarbamoyladenosine(37)-C(2))-methylthiotransferase MtaB [Breznakia sp. OttesenSCG-928-G09]